MRRLIYYVACSVDGFIARADGSFDFALAQGEHFVDLIARYPETFPGHLRDVLGITAANQAFDAVLMGRTTYEVGLALGVTTEIDELILKINPSRSDRAFRSCRVKCRRRR